MDTKQLVSIGRENIDDTDINGFIVKESDELLLLQVIYDFCMDGLKVIRQSDTSDITQFKTDIFQTERLKERGIYEKVKFNADYDLDSWQLFFTSAQDDYDFFIVENELEEEFNLGLVTNILSDKIVMKTCDGTGNWHPSDITILYKDISSVQIDSTYARVYEEFMMRGE